MTAGEAGPRRVERRIAIGYLVFQGLSVVGWWALLFLAPETRHLFFPESYTTTVIVSFALPDLVLVAGGSLAAALALRCKHPLGGFVAVGVASSLAYGTLFCLVATWREDSAYLGLALMIGATMVSVYVALISVGESAPFFGTYRGSRGSAFVFTASQVSVFWGFFLGVMPWIVLQAERESGWAPYEFAGQVPVAVGLFVAWGTLGLSAAWTMTGRGEGTPLPLAGPRRLVEAGPYRWLRNPMAVAGLGQGLAVAIGTGSTFIPVYVLLGGLGWELLVRPIEEQYLETEFGESFREYRQRVRCWIPGRRA